MFTLVIGSVLSLVYYDQQSWLIPTLLILASLTIISVSFHCRSFALKAQDRVIRAEENLRYFILTGKRLDQRITLKQIIALRFASDEELVALVERVLHENLDNDSIKRAIVNWRPDYYRA